MGGCTWRFSASLNIRLIVGRPWALGDGESDVRTVHKCMTIGTIFLAFIYQQILMEYRNMYMYTDKLLIIVNRNHMNYKQKLHYKLF